MPEEITANYVSCSNHNSPAHHVTSADMHDVMSRDSQSRHHCDDVIPGPLPLLLPSATDIVVRNISDLWPSWLESVDGYRRRQLLAVYAWRLLLAGTALHLTGTTDIDRSLPNHDTNAAAVSTVTRGESRAEIVDRSLRRFHPYFISR